MVDSWDVGMDRLDRLILILLVLAITGWRLARYMHLGMGKRRSSIGIEGGTFPPRSDSAAPGSTESKPNSFQVKIVATLVAVSAQIAISEDCSSDPIGDCWNIFELLSHSIRR